MFVTMAEKETKVLNSCVPMEQYSVKKSLHAIGGTTWTVVLQQATISKFEIIINPKKFVQKHFFSSLNADPEHNPYFPKKKLEEIHGNKFLIHP